MKAEIRPGQSFPLGATLYPDGVNFSVYSKNAAGIDLLLFNEASGPKPPQIISLDPGKNRTYHYWHIFLSGLKHGQLYGYRVRGPFEPDAGFALTRIRFYSIHTPDAWSYLKITAAWRPPSRETMPPRQ